MMIFEANGKKYKVEFGYRALVKDGLIDRLANFKDNKESMLTDTLNMIAELLLAGLQKNHAEFRYDTPDEKIEKLDEIYDLMDTIDVEGKIDVFDLNGKISEELMNTGFLSRMAKAANEPEKVTKAAKKGTK